MGLCYARAVGPKVFVGENTAHHYQEMRSLESKPRKLPELAPISLVTEIKEYSKYAAFAYCDYSVATQPSQGALVTAIKSPKTKTHVHVYYNNHTKEIVVSFRGADTLGKFFKAYSSAKEELINMPGARVNKNVLAYASSIRDPLIREVSKLIKHRCQHHIVLVGHSLGGSLATLMGPILSNKFNIDPPRIRIITYNQPRVGNEAFVNYYNKLSFNFTRVVNKDDPAPNHPAPWNGWVHVQREVYISPQNTYHLCSNRTNEDPSCSFKKSSLTAITKNHNSIANMDIFNGFSSYCKPSLSPTYEPNINHPQIQNALSKRKSLYQSNQPTHVSDLNRIRHPNVH
ncbi:hypothetical protein DSO57_1015114 [Entomophthora muscae]|uniref:Uncharacterized protein n=1 Tax=Entomophthora muscae TaxID=34485 RepID=A0ACC2SUD4_9FUNG|nr:hypothetical protein DSO57_1015114 [Entomophthora muscae]